MDHVPSEATAPLVDALTRVVDTIRRMPPASLRSAGRVEAARALARAVASVVQGIEEAGSATPPAWRELPDVPDFVVGDQLAVLAHDLQLVVAAGAPAEVWTPTGRAPVADTLAALLFIITKTNGAL